MVFEAHGASLMRFRHGFLSSESVAGCVHYILRELRVLSRSISAMNFFNLLAR